MIAEVLKSLPSYSDPNNAFKIYVMAFHILIEKCFEIMKIVGFPKAYKEKDFLCFAELNLWANFFKHPKAFILAHHPEYFFKTKMLEKHINKKNGDKIVDVDFLEKYYKGEDSNKYKNLISELKHNTNVKVIIPRIDILTNNLCNAFILLIAILEENKIYKELLNDLATLDKYFNE